MQIQRGIDAINNGFTMCYPFQWWIYLDINESNELRNNNSLLFLDTYLDSGFKAAIKRASVGGVFFVNKDKYLSRGGENEHFYGWSPEDIERVKRMEILQEPICRINGPLFHLYHPRGINSTSGYDERDKNNLNELIKVCRMNAVELQKYISTWKWIK